MVGAPPDVICVCFRWSERHLMLHLSSVADYEAVAKAVMDKQAGDLDEVSVLALESMYTA